MPPKTKLHDMVSYVDEDKQTKHMRRDKRVFQLVAAGCTHEAAAVFSGIHESTFYLWRARGKKAKSGIFHEFYKGLMQAEAAAEVTLTLQMRHHARSDVQAAKFMLERRFGHNGWRDRKVIEQEIIVPDSAGPVIAIVGALVSMEPTQLAALAGNDLDELDGMTLPTRRIVEAPNDEADSG